MNDLDWSYWKNLKFRWAVGPEERLWLRNRGDVVVARGIGYSVAAICGAVMIGVGIPYTMPINVAEGVAFIALGGLLLKGKRWAALVLMSLITIDQIARNSPAYQHTMSHHHPALRAATALLVVTIMIRVFYVAYSTEGRWAATRAAKSTEASASPPAS